MFYSSAVSIALFPGEISPWRSQAEVLQLREAAESHGSIARRLPPPCFRRGGMVKKGAVKSRVSRVKSTKKQKQKLKVVKNSLKLCFIFGRAAEACGSSFSCRQDFGHHEGEQRSLSCKIR